MKQIFPNPDAWFDAVPIQPDIPAPAKPHIGAIVWYRDVHSIKPYPAIVVGHDDGDSADAARVDLLVNTSPGLSWETDVEYGTDPGEWRWPDSQE
jgi:hypothetical protein